MRREQTGAAHTHIIICITTSIHPCCQGRPTSPTVTTYLSLWSLHSLAPSCCCSDHPSSPAGIRLNFAPGMKHCPWIKCSCRAWSKNRKRWKLSWIRCKMLTHSVLNADYKFLGVCYKFLLKSFKAWKMIGMSVSGLLHRTTSGDFLNIKKNIKFKKIYST